MIADQTVCIVFAIAGISIDVVGVYDNQNTAIKRVEELRNLGLLQDCNIEYQNELVWEEKE